MKLIKYLFSFGLLFITACSTLNLNPADFAWPLESVLKVDSEGFVEERRYSITFNTRDLFLKETGDSLSYMDKEIRLIRDTEGYYFITSDNFKKVYVFNGVDGAMKLDKEIGISETGITNPAFNQRPPFIELVTDSLKLLLSNEGIKENENEE